MLDPATIQSFDRIYSTDLVYARDCWKLCGDAHCCNFGRYRSKFTMLNRKFHQELPLLPGEYEYLQHKNWLSRFPDSEYKMIEYPLSTGRIKAEFIMSRSPTCACEHDTRTTVCRLYPLLPIYDLDGTLVGVDNHFGIFEEIEEIDHLERACKLTNILFAELGKFLMIAAEIGEMPKAVFYAMVYQLTKRQARMQLETAKARRPASAVLDAFEGMFLLRQLLDQNVLRPQLESLAEQFKEHYGPRFSLD